MKEKDLLRIQVFNADSPPETFHLDAELFYVLEGSLTITIGEQSSALQQDDVFIVNLHKSYQAQVSSDATYIKLSLPSQMMSQKVQNSHMLFWCDSSREENSNYQELRNILKQMLNRYLATQENTSDFGYLSLAYRLLDVLISHFTTNMVSSSEEDRFQERIGQINSYINMNYNQPLSSKELADNLYLSQGYLTRFFRKNYGQSFMEKSSKCVIISPKQSISPHFLKIATPNYYLFTTGD